MFRIKIKWLPERYIFTLLCWTCIGHLKNNLVRLKRSYVRFNASIDLVRRSLQKKKKNGINLCMSKNYYFRKYFNLLILLKNHHNS